jgi:O-antigen/teichoic acid export membrane protein
MLTRNLIANYLGQGWGALMGIAFVPLYIRFLGIEAYGLIGMFVVLQAWLSLLDMGMTPTLNREMARFTGGVHSETSIRNLLRSVEGIALGIAVFIMLGIWAVSGWLAEDWLQTQDMPVAVAARAFTVMGCVIALRFIEGIYRSCLIGLQRQVLFNSIYSVMATLRGAGAVMILAWVSPTIQTFFIWQGLVSLLSLMMLCAATYHALPGTGPGGRFSISALKNIRRFAGGMMGITFLAVLLTQMDKILLSRLLTLSEYGYYTLATAVAGALYVLNAPITTAWFPRLSELHATHQPALLAETFHQGAQLVSVCMGSAAMILIVFAEPILRVWTQDPGLAGRSAALLSLLALGNLLNGLMHIPYQTQLAHGWTRLTLWLNIVSVAVIVPAILWTTPRYGAEGAAWVWVGLNAGYVFIGIHFMYHKILTTEKWRWYVQDLLLPLLAAGSVAGCLFWIMPARLSDPVQLAWLAASCVLTVFAATLAASCVRKTAWLKATLLLKKMEIFHT